MQQESIAILFELAGTAEDQLEDAARAFVYLPRRTTISRSPQTLAELRHMAERHSLWEEMCEVYATQPGLESRLRVAEIADEKLHDPKRAFNVIRAR